MSQAVLWGVSVGVSLFLLNYLIFLKIFRINRFSEKTKKTKGDYIFLIVLGLVLAEIFYFGNMVGYIETKPGMEHGSANYYVYVSLIDGSFFVSFWGFLFIPPYLEKMKKKKGDA